MADITTLLGYILSIAMAGLAFACWRKAVSFHVLLVESANRFESLKQHAAKMEKDHLKLIERHDGLKEANVRLEKQLNTNKSKIEADFRRLETRAIEAEEHKVQLELKIDHLRPQVEALTRQLQESDLALKEAQTKLSYAASAAEKRSNSLRADFEKQAEEARRRIRELELLSKQNESELIRIRKETGDLDLEKIKDLTRKASHFENLYRSMRGLREMADERNRNWEVALKKLASWILAQKRSPIDTETASLGPMVGEALEIIGERLVQDEFSGKLSPSILAPGHSSKQLDLES